MRPGRPKQTYTTTELKEIIKNEIQEDRTRALAATLYLTGARITEILHTLTKNHIQKIKTQDGTTITIFKNLPVKKRRQEMYRNVPVSPNNNDLVQILLDYAKPLQKNQAIFPFNRWTAWKIMSKEKTRHNRPLWNHFWRHMRATNAVVEDDFDALYLTRFMGWANIRHSEKYVSLGTKDIENKLVKKWKENK